MLYLIGIGLNDENDITLKGLELVKKSEYVFLEDYTSLLQSNKEKLEELYGKKIILANRELVEKGTEIIDKAVNDDVVFLVVGDVFGATTHTDLLLRAEEKNIPTKIIHNASVLTAVGITGLELYKFGKTTSLPYWTESYKPESAYDVIKENKARGLHSLVLLDIKADEKRFMTIREAIELLELIEEKRKEGIISEKILLVGCARLGGDEVIKYGSLQELKQYDFGKPLHCLIIPGELHFVEKKGLERFARV